MSLGGIASSGIVYVNEDNTFLGPDAGDDSQTNVRRVMINMSDIEQTDIK
ncbi:MAG: hypothetical protein MJ200_04140 [Mycoplasmoidaceae bacterium]|nr:hypothetical protein [Mycoplasmoidaceae bacterium]